MEIKVLGTGCKKCSMLAEAVVKAADELGIDYTLEKVTDLKDIMAFGVMSTPGLVIDGSVKLTGKVPSIPELKELLK